MLRWPLEQQRGDSSRETSGETSGRTRSALEPLALARRGEPPQLESQCTTRRRRAGPTRQTDAGWALARLALGLLVALNLCAARGEVSAVRATTSAQTLAAGSRRGGSRRRGTRRRAGGEGSTAGSDLG